MMNSGSTFPSIRRRAQAHVTIRSWCTGCAIPNGPVWITVLPLLPRAPFIAYASPCAARYRCSPGIIAVAPLCAWTVLFFFFFFFLAVAGARAGTESGREFTYETQPPSPITQGQTVIGFSTSGRHASLDDVEPVHVQPWPPVVGASKKSRAARVDPGPGAAKKSASSETTISAVASL